MWPILIIATLVLALAVVHASWRRRFERLQNEVRAKLQEQRLDQEQPARPAAHGYVPSEVSTTLSGYMSTTAASHRSAAACPSR